MTQHLVILRNALAASQSDSTNIVSSYRKHQLKLEHY
jgi:hypothetical protein